MNLRELQRITTPALPGPGENQRSIVSKTNDAIKEAFKRDGDKEQRLRILENERGRGITRNTVDQLLAALYLLLTTPSGKILKTRRVTTGPVALLVDDYALFVNTDAGDVVVNLPAGIEGTSYWIINCGSSGNRAILTPNGTENLFGANATDALIDGEDEIIVFNGTEGWW